ncbi:MAG: DUF1538 domain-containing protein [Gammaproteobacteria bacterium]|nr:DUF1538 domain-containing protein [Gammaproteobacteria bacterium]MDH3505958.1 DUF1538 domain-containing protein [Gammaproteobacteria bacterium]
MARFWRVALGSLRDLTPIVLVIFFFQAIVLQRPLAELIVLTEGAILVVVGLTLFVYGLELALFPIGETLAHALARKGSVAWLVIFAFFLGFGTTIAEPALIAVASEAATAASVAGAIADSENARASYVLGLRLTVACSVGVALVIGIARIVAGWSLPRMIIAGYVIVVLITFLAPAEIVGIAYDSGGVTTSTVTVPLVTALGVGLASSLGGRNPMTDGFGLIAFASLTPMIFVMSYGMLVTWA